MIPCTTRRYGPFVRASGLNGEPFHTWAWSHSRAEAKWLKIYDYTFLR